MLKGKNLESMMQKEGELQVVLFSFGFKYGTPVDSNMILDVRFLPNPYWVTELRSKNGKDAEVADFVLESHEGAVFMEYLKTMLLFLIDKNIVAGKRTMRIGIGCTGGCHRSVAVVEAIGIFMAEESVCAMRFHRDIEKDTLVLS